MHALYEDPEVVAAVVGRFGDAILGPVGAVDRQALAARAFAEEGGLRDLEAIIFPRVGAARERWIAGQAARVPPPDLLVCEVPLLFEADLAHLFDAALLVTASDAVRRARVEARGQDFDARRARQMPEDRKAERADRVFVNDGTRDALRGWVADRYLEYAGRACHASRLDH